MKTATSTKNSLVLRRASLYYGSTACDVKHHFFRDMGSKDETVTVRIDLDDDASILKLADRVLARLFEIREARVSIHPGGNIHIFGNGFGGNGFGVDFSTDQYVTKSPLGIEATDKESLAKWFADQNAGRREIEIPQK